MIGMPSFGKGSVQTIIPLSGARNGALRLTTAKFYSPADHNYAKIGVKPDVESAARDLIAGLGTDSQERSPGDLTAGPSAQSQERSSGYRGGDAVPLVAYGQLDLSDPDIIAARKVFQSANHAVTSR